MSNKILLGSVAGVGGLAILNAVKTGKGITRIVAGTYLVLLLLSLLDLFGGVWSSIASGLAVLALVSSLLLFDWRTLTKVSGAQSTPSSGVTEGTNTKGGTPSTGIR